MSYKRPKAQLLNTSRLSAQSHPQIHKNAVFEARVKGLADTGNAVVNHPSGLLFFVAGAWLGELIKVRVLELKSKFGLAELVEVIEPSEHRIEPPCLHHGVIGKACGGCSWMFVAYSAQLQAKQERVSQALTRIDPKCTIQPILAAKQPLGYRIRAQFKTDGKIMGFVASGKRELAKIDDCVVLTDTNRATIKGLKAQLPNNEWVPSSRKKDWTTLDVDESTSIEAVSVNQRLPFKQANEQQNQVMKSWLREKLSGLNKKAKVLELFAGSGNFTQDISNSGFESIVAVEVIDEAVSALQAQGLSGVTAVTCNLFREDAFERLLRENGDTEVLVLDPPREGLKVKTGLFTKKSKIRDVLYISCDLSTLCRDLREFNEKGFRLVDVQALDLMPQTPHVEVLVHLRKKK